jgi:hypothetical protein
MMKGQCSILPLFQIKKANMSENCAKHQKITKKYIQLPPHQILITLYLRAQVKKIQVYIIRINVWAKGPEV